MIVVKISDGLGNQLFQYAYARILQERVSQKVYLDVSDINNLSNKKYEITEWIKLCDSREYQLNNFLITLPVIDTKKLLKFRKDMKESKFQKYCKELRLLPVVHMEESECKVYGFKFSKYQSYYLEGGFFDKSYYENSQYILKKELKLKKELFVPRYIKQLLVNRNTVSLHIRRGDFLKVGRNISETDYYDKAIKHIRNCVKKPFLFIFSDDIEWVKFMMKIDIEHEYISDKGFSDCEELILMSKCRHNIIANSTYSYWGAWLNQNEDKIVVAPKGWRKKIIPESWILV